MSKNDSVTPVAGSPDKTLVFPPLRESPTSTVYGEQVFYSRNRLSPDRWSIEAAEAIVGTESAEVLFERLIADEPTNYHPHIVKPSFEPIYYDPEDVPRKYRRMCAIAHENEIKKRLANTGLTAKGIEQYATNASYYPGAVGSKYEPVRPWSFKITPPRISMSSSDGEQSPLFLFKDLPAELPKRKIPVPSSSAIIQPSTSESPVSLKRERNSLVLPPKTPDRKPIANGWNAPTNSFVDAVDHLSPVFDRMNVTLRRRRKFEKKSLISPLASIHETPEHPAKPVPFIKKGPMESGREPDTIIGAFRLKIERKSTDSVTTRPSPGYQPSHPIVLLVPKSTTTKYQALLEKFSQDFNVVIFEGQFDYEKVTHVIFDEDNTDEGNLQKIQAIGFQKYLIRSDWIQDCLSNGPMLDPALYEVDVPPSRIARISNAGLFVDYAFLCAKPFRKIEFEELRKLLIYNGASFVFYPSDFFVHSDKVRVCIVGELEYFDEPRNKHKLRQKLKQWKCVKVHYQWIFDAFATYSLPPIIQYLFDSKLEEVRDAGVPEDLIN